MGRAVLGLHGWCRCPPAPVVPSERPDAELAPVDTRKGWNAEMLVALLIAVLVVLIVVALVLLQRRRRSGGVIAAPPQARRRQ